MKEYRLFIDGVWCAGEPAKTVVIRNPATGAPFARVHQAGRDDAASAVAAAHRAFAEWRRVGPAAREALLLRAAEVIAERTDELRDILIQESGSTFGKASFEIAAAREFLKSAAGECRRISGKTFVSDVPGLVSYCIRRPLGVVVAISPFNFPLLLSLKKLAFALAAGNTVVLKPSEATPVIGLKIAEIFEEAGAAPGVVNVIPGEGAEVGEVLTGHAQVKLVSFTGSTRVGKAIAAQAAANLKKVMLELGGKNPLIVLADADLDYAVETAAFGLFIHQGQVCMAGSRIIVEAPIYEAFCAALGGKAQALKVGDPAEPETVIGPLIRDSQAPFIQALVDAAVAAGARLVTGGRHEGPFYHPTVLADVTPEMEIFHTECFGPVGVVVQADDPAHALELANDNAYGLSSAVLTRNIDHAQMFVDGLEAGMVHVNGPTVHDETNVPFGGVRMSGLGREGGRFSIDDMTELKWVTIQTGRRHYPF